jgi:PIN domain nuclease of toxin-antitoxin system
VNLLLDTHTWLWMMIEPNRIGKKTKALCADPRSSFRLSIASVWEIAIKHAAGRLTLPDDPLRYVVSRTREDGIALLPIQVEHVCLAAQLPRHHGDLFDRLLVAQAQSENLVLLTHDADIKKYDIDVRDPAA